MMTDTELITLTASILLAARVCEDRKEAIRYAFNLIELASFHRKQLEQELNSEAPSALRGLPPEVQKRMLFRRHMPTCNAVLLLDETKCNCGAHWPEMQDASSRGRFPL